MGPTTSIRRKSWVPHYSGGINGSHHTKLEMQVRPLALGHPGHVTSSRVPLPLIFSGSVGPA